MVVDASSFRNEGVAELELIFHQNMEDSRMLLALETELDRRSTPRARELRGKVRQQLVSLSAVDARKANAKPWYRRGGVLLSAAAVVVAGVAQGIFHAAGFHMWEPIWRRLQDLMSAW
jgi:hypothetical protein